MSAVMPHDENANGSIDAAEQEMIGKTPEVGSPAFTLHKMKFSRVLARRVDASHEFVEKGVSKFGPGYCIVVS